MVSVPGRQLALLPKSSILDDSPRNCKIEMILTCLAAFWKVRTSYLLENGSKRPSEALSTVTTIRKLNANNNNNKPGQH